MMKSLDKTLKKVINENHNIKIIETYETFIFPKSINKSFYKY